MDLAFDGRVCVVTGASRGIGLATARLLSADGARVLLVGRDGGRVDEAARKVGGEGLAADVTDPGAARTIVERAEALGGLYALVNNAGTSFARALEELTDADWQGQWELHVMAPMRLMRTVAPAMAVRGEGRIVNVCSSAGKPTRTRSPPSSPFCAPRWPRRSPARPGAPTGEPWRASSDRAARCSRRPGRRRRRGPD